MAPITDTKRLHTLKPVTPVEPAAVKIHPPMTPPTIPRTISRKSPSPVLLIIMLAIQPAKPPRTIQLITPIACSSRVRARCRIRHFTTEDTEEQSVVHEGFAPRVLSVHCGQ